MKDRKKVVFAILNLIQGAIIGAILLLVPSREVWVNWFLGAAAVSMIVAAPALVFGGRFGGRIAAIACLIHGAIGSLFAVFIAASASYLYGIYGRHGFTVGSIAFAITGVVLIVFWLIPVHELYFLKKNEVLK